MVLAGQIRFLLPVSTLLLAIFMLMAGSGALPAILGLRLDAEGQRAPVIAMVGACYFLGLTAGSLRVFALIRRVGHIRAFAAFVSLYSASAITYSLIPDVRVWMALRLVDGFSVAGIFVCLESWLGDRAEETRRGATIAFYMIALYGGQALSQALLGLSGANAAQPFIIASLLLSLTIGPVALTRMAEPVVTDHRALTLRALYRASPLGLVVAASTGAMLGAFYGLGAVHAQRIGLSNVAIAGLMASVIAGGMALQWPLGRLSDKFDRRKVIVGTLAVTVCICIALAWNPVPSAFTVMATAFGGFVFALYPLCVAQMHDHLVPEERTGASGGLILVYSLGAAAGPLLGSLAMMRIGPGALYGFIAACAFAAFCFGVWRQMIADPVPAQDQRQFQILPRTTMVVGSIDPEAQPPA